MVRHIIELSILEVSKKWLVIDAGYADSLPGGLRMADASPGRDGRIDEAQAPCETLW